MNNSKGRIKKYLIIMSVLWIVFAIVLVCPLAFSIVESTNEQGTLSISMFINKLMPSITDISTRFKVFSSQYIGTLGKTLLYYSFFFVIISIIFYLKNKSKGEYYNIEHGSSDWSENGEQYRVLSKNKGIILAEDNYLPVDKRGNINTLIVGRIWFW